MEPRSRLVALERSFNFRDLGGYVGHHGSVTRWGTLFRSDTLHELTGPDIETVRKLGLDAALLMRLAPFGVRLSQRSLARPSIPARQIQ